jgi:hypothetical protein
VSYNLKILSSILKSSGLNPEAKDILTLSEGPTKLYIFDFDGTLFRSPMKPALWGGSWWGNEASISPPCVPQTPSDDWWVSDTVSAARAAINDSSALSIMMTGRKKTEEMYLRVGELLSSAGLTFHKVILSDSFDTKAFKSGQISKIISENPTINFVKIYDDRPGYLEEYSNLIKGLNDQIKVETVLVQVASKPAECDEVVPEEIELPKKTSAMVIRLTSESKGKLSEMFPLSYDNPAGEYVEVISKPNLKDLEQAKETGLLGKKFQVNLTGYIDDGMAQLVTVNVPEAEFSEGLTPHILLSTAKGVKQLYSKELAKKVVEPITGEPLTGIMWWK